MASYVLTRVKPVTRAKHIPTRSLGQFYEATLAKELATCTAGYNLVVMWEYDCYRLKQHLGQMLRGTPRWLFMSYVLYSSGSRYGAVVNAPPKSDPTTCQAGLRLYSYLEMAGGNAFYFTDSTDSVIYKWWPGQPEIPLSSFLGDMTDDLEDPEDYLEEFVSGVPRTMVIAPTKENFAAKCVASRSTSGADGSSTRTFSNRMCYKNCEVLSMDPGRCPCSTHISSRGTKTTSWKRPPKPDATSWS